VDCSLRAGLIPFQSPLLRESLLVSFPPLSDMLKFRGYSPLTRGRQCLSSAGGKVVRELELQQRWLFLYRNCE
jgi:hypothetical protein